MNISSSTYPRRSPGVFAGIYRPILLVCSIALFTIVALSVTAGLISWDFLRFLFASALFVTGLCVAPPLAGTTLISSRKSFLTLTLVIWVFLMVSEGIFVHFQTTQSAESGHIDPATLYQAGSWIMCFLALAFISCFRSDYLWRLFTGPLKWVSIFAVVAVISCPLSPNVLYSVALAFKLCVIVLTLFAIGEGIEDKAGISSLFAALFLGMLIVVTAEFVAPFLGPNPAFRGDRLGVLIGLSGTCGMLLLLSTLFFIRQKNPWFALIAAYSVTVMMLAGSKGGMVASLVSLSMFFVLLKKPAQALAATFGFAIIFMLCVAFTPLGTALQKYSESDNATTLTGRTNLWTAAWPEIKAHPLLGHGYRASRFLSEDVQGAFTEAGNMHNSFLEVLYNNGLVGLIPIVIINLLIVANLRRAMVRPSTEELRYYAAAAFALYIHLLVWGLVAATFGGAPDVRFMVFFAILVISMFLRGQADRKYWNTTYGEHVS